MATQEKFKKALIGLAAGAVLFGAVPATALASAHPAQASSSAQPQTGQAREVHMTVKSVYVSKDGDPGAASACGEVESYVRIRDMDSLDTQLLGLPAVKSTSTEFWLGDLGVVQQWCEGALELAAPMPHVANKSVFQAIPGHKLELTSIAKEYDKPGEDIRAEGVAEVVIPESGHARNVFVFADEANASGRLKLIYMVEIRTL